MRGVHVKRNLKDTKKAGVDQYMRKYYSDCYNRDIQVHNLKKFSAVEISSYMIHGTVKNTTTTITNYHKKMKIIFTTGIQGKLFGISLLKPLLLFSSFSF